MFAVAPYYNSMWFKFYNWKNCGKKARAAGFLQHYNGLSFYFKPVSVGSSLCMFVFERLMLTGRLIYY